MLPVVWDWGIFGRKNQSLRQRTIVMLHCERSSQTITVDHCRGIRHILGMIADKAQRVGSANSLSKK